MTRLGISSLRLADISFPLHEDEYVQSSEVVYTTDSVAAVGRWQRRIFVAITIYWHVLKARRGAQDRAVLASDSSISLSDGWG